MEHAPNPYDDFEVVSTYTDREAVEDGLLVAVSRQDRVHRAVWEKFCERVPQDAKPPNCWPVDLMGWFTATKISAKQGLELLTKYGADRAPHEVKRIIEDRKTLALCKGIFSTHARQARRVYDENIGGGIFSLWAECVGSDFDGKGILSELSLTDRALPGALKLWLMPNENGGMSLLFPEDY